MRGNSPEFELDFACFQFGHFRGVFHQFVQAVALLVHDLQQLLLMAALRRMSGQQGTDGGFYRGQWRPEIVGDGVQQGGFETFTLAIGFGAAQLLDRARPFDRNSQQSANRLQGLARERRARDSKTADGLHSQPHRTVTKSSRGIDIRLFALVGEPQLFFFQLQRAIAGAVKFLLVGQEQAGGAAFKGLHDVIGNRIH